MNIDSLVKTIDRHKGYKVYEVDSDKFSSEGSKLTGYFNALKKLCHLSVEHFGEMGKRKLDYFFFNDTMIFKRVVNFTYDKPFYIEGYKKMSDTLSYNCFKYSKGCQDSTFLEEKLVFMNNISF